MIKFTKTTSGHHDLHVVEAWLNFNSCLASRMHNDTISGRATLQCHDQKSWSRSQRHDPHPLSSSNVRIALIDSLWRLILSKLFCCSLAQGSRLPQPSNWWRFSKMSRFEVGWFIYEPMSRTSVNKPAMRRSTSKSIWGLLRHQNNKNPISYFATRILFSQTDRIKKAP